VEATRHQFLPFIAYRSLLIEQVSKIHYGLPLSGDETQARQILRERNADVRVVSHNLTLKWINGKNGLFGREPQHG
jgi:hypothetical protein